MESPLAHCATPEALRPVDSRTAERRTWVVIGLTALMMAGEIAAGLVFNSMALLADGWHMASHAGALGITAFAYAYARRHCDDPRYSYGTGKVGVLGGYTNAVVLAIIAILMCVASVERLLSPASIGFDEALFVAVLGLTVNLASAWVLTRGHEHEHGHGHGHGHDHNLRAAYLHVITDALTSVLAIMALLTGKYFGWIWMDPLMGIVGGAVILRWSLGLLRDTTHILLDEQLHASQLAQLRESLERGEEDRVVDLHLWRLGPRQVGAVVSLVAHTPRPAQHYKDKLASIPDLAHVTVEVNPCRCFEGRECELRRGGRA